MSFDNDHPNRKDHRKTYRNPSNGAGAAASTVPVVGARTTASTAPSSASRRQRSVYALLRRAQAALGLGLGFFVTFQTITIQLRAHGRICHTPSSPFSNAIQVGRPHNPPHHQLK